MVQPRNPKLKNNGRRLLQSVSLVAPKIRLQRRTDYIIIIIQYYFTVGIIFLQCWSVPTRQVWLSQCVTWSWYLQQQREKEKRQLRTIIPSFRISTISHLKFHSILIFSSRKNPTCDSLVGHFSNDVFFCAQTMASDTFLTENESILAIQRKRSLALGTENQPTRLEIKYTYKAWCVNFAPISAFFRLFRNLLIPTKSLFFFHSSLFLRSTRLDMRSQRRRRWMPLCLRVTMDRGDFALAVSWCARYKGAVFYAPAIGVGVCS